MKTLSASFVVILLLLGAAVECFAADANVVIPWQGGKLFTTNVYFYVENVGASKTLGVSPQSGYRFKEGPKVTPGSEQDVNVTQAGTTFTVRIVSEKKQGMVHVEGKIEPIPTGGGGGGGPPPEQPFDISIFQKWARLFFSRPLGGTNLYCMVGVTNAIKANVLLGDMTVPTSGTVRFNAGDKGTFTRSEVALAGGVAETDFIAAETPGMGAILADAKDLKDGNNTVPNLSTNLPVRLFKIVQDNDLWWFNGEEPAGFDRETTLTANSGGFVAGESYFWFIPVGSDKAAFGTASSKTTANNQVDINSMGSSAYRENDVSIALNVNNILVNGRYRTHVYAPYRLDLIRVEHNTVDLAGITLTNAFSSDFTYQIVDNGNRRIEEVIDINEQFPGGAIPDCDNDWLNPPAESGPAKKPKPGQFIDHIAEGAGYSYNTNPEPQAPQSPLGTKKVFHKDQIWRVGSAAFGKGVTVQKGTIQFFNDHGEIQNIQTPFP